MFNLNSDIYMPIILVFIGFIIGKWRDNSKIVFNKKLEIYSDIIYKLNAGEFFTQNLKTRLNKVLDNFKKIISAEKIEGNNREIKYVEKEIDDINYELEKISHRDSLIKLFAPARIIGNKEVVREIRNYYDLAIEFLDNKNEKDHKKINKDLNQCVMKLEQLMRQDLLGFWNRDLSDFDIRKHVEK